MAFCHLFLYAIMDIKKGNKVGELRKNSTYEDIEK